MNQPTDIPNDMTALRQRFAELERPRRPRSTRDVILHELMPEIEKKLRRGWRYADIVAGLREVGLSVSVQTLRNYVTKARQDRSRSAASAPTKSSQRQSAAASKGAEKTSSPAVESPATTASMETTKTQAARIHRRAKNKAFAGFDESP